MQIYSINGKFNYCNNNVSLIRKLSSIFAIFIFLMIEDKHGPDVLKEGIKCSYNIIGFTFNVSRFIYNP